MRRHNSDQVRLLMASIMRDRLKAVLRPLFTVAKLGASDLAGGCRLLLSLIPGNLGWWLRRRAYGRVALIGQGVMIDEFVRLEKPELLRIGAGTFIGRGSFIHAGGTVVIGDDVLLLGRA